MNQDTANRAQLIAVYADRSDAAQRAVEIGLRLAAAHGARLSVWTVKSPSMPQRTDDVGLNHADARRLAESLGVEANNAVLAGEDAAEVLLAETRRLQPDLLLFGDRSSSRWLRVLGHGTAPVLLRRARVPMIVTSASSTIPASGQLNRLMVAVDFSEGARRAIEAAQALAELHNAEIHPIHVDNTPRPPRVSAQQIEKFDQKILFRLQAFCTGFSRIRPDHCEVVRGKPVAHALDQAAERVSADLIVIGTLGLTGMGRLLLGSVAERLTLESPRPVLVIPAGD